MQKGDKARVIRDCAVKAGSEVEVVESKYVGYEKPEICVCYFNGIRVEIAESDLEVIKAKRWEPSIRQWYWFPNLYNHQSCESKWDNSISDRNRLETCGVFKTREESDVMLAKIQALVTSEIGDC